MLLCGADVMASLIVPGVWEAPEELLEEHGIACVVREGTDLEELMQYDMMARCASALYAGMRLLLHCWVEGTKMVALLQHELMARCALMRDMQHTMGAHFSVMCSI